MIFWKRMKMSQCVGESWPYPIIPGLMSLSDMRTARLDSWMLTEKAWMVIKLLGHQRNIKAIEPYLSQSFRSLKKRAYLDLPPYSNTIIIAIDRSYIISNVMILFTEQATHEWLVVTSSKVTTNHVMWCSCERMSTALPWRPIESPASILPCAWCVRTLGSTFALSDNWNHNTQVSIVVAQGGK